VHKTFGIITRDNHNRNGFEGMRITIDSINKKYIPTLYVDCARLMRSDRYCMVSGFSLCYVEWKKI
jgi:hypothetical protein